MVVAAGGQRYAVAQQAVHGLQRLEVGAAVVGLADLLGNTTAADEQLALVISVSEQTVALRVRHADLRGNLPRFPLPAWLAPQAHPAVRGFILDDTELMPLVDLVQLARQIGHDAP